MIRSEVKDPRIGMVTLTEVEVTPDYAHAKVFYTVLPSDPETLTRTAAGLRRAAPFLRAQLGRRIRIHTTPELKFVHDATPEQGLALSRLIDEAVSRQVVDDEPPKA